MESVALDFSKDRAINQMVSRKQPRQDPRPVVVLANGPVRDSSPKRRSVNAHPLPKRIRVDRFNKKEQLFVKFSHLNILLLFRYERQRAHNMAEISALEAEESESKDGVQHHGSITSIAKYAATSSSFVDFCFYRNTYLANRCKSSKGPFHSLQDAMAECNAIHAYGVTWTPSLDDPSVYVFEVRMSKRTAASPCHEHSWVREK